MKQAKVLFLDTETSPNTAYVWKLFKENIPLARLIDSSEVLCWTAKWKDSGLIYDSIFESSTKDMLQNIASLLDQADVVVHYNGSSFDIPILNKEFLLNGISPPSPYKQIDLYRTVKSNFRFTSNKLDYICQRLGIGKKTETTFQLWVDCMKKDPLAWKVMKEYNMNDVLMLEALYYKLLPWIKNHPNIAILEEKEHVCPKCTSNNYQKRGYLYTNSYRYSRYRCNSCGTWFKSVKNELKIERTTIL